MTRKQKLVALGLVLEKILDAAVAGQNGSAAYALDRLRLVQQYAEIGLKKARP